MSDGADLKDGAAAFSSPLDGQILFYLNLLHESLNYKKAVPAFRFNLV